MRGLTMNLSSRPYKSTRWGQRSTRGKASCSSCWVILQGCLRCTLPLLLRLLPLKLHCQHLLDVDRLILLFRLFLDYFSDSALEEVDFLADFLAPAPVSVG